MPELKLGPLPKERSRLVEIKHKETLAMLDPGLGDHVIRNDTHVFDRTSLFWMPAAWRDRPDAELRRLLDQPLQAIYEKNRQNGIEVGRESGDYNYQALLEATGRVLDTSELANKPWKEIFRLYLVTEDGDCKLVSNDEMEEAIATQSAV